MHKIFKKVLGKNKLITFLTVLFAVIVAAAMSFASSSLSKLFDVVEKKVAEPIPVMVQNTLFIVLAFIIALLLDLIFNLLKAKYTYNFGNAFRDEITLKISNTPFGNFDNKNTGNYVSWYTNDVKELLTLSSGAYINIFQQSAVVISSFYFMSTLNMFFGLIALGFLAIAIIVPQLFNGFVAKAQKRLSLADEVLTEETREAVGGFNIFYINNKLAKFKELISEASIKRQKTAFNYTKVRAYVSLGTMLVSLTAQIGLTIVTVFFSVTGRAPLGAAIAVASLSGLMFNGVGSLVDSITQFKSAKPIFEKFEYELTQSEDKKLSDLKSIKFSNVDLSFEENEVFKNLNLSIDTNKKYAILGESGSGKTTLLKLMLGLHSPTGGTVYANDDDIERIKKESFYSQIAYIDQNVYLFKGSIRDNISLWKDVSDEEINNAISKANLTKFIEKQELGMNSLIDESGKNISGGEKQRIALARAFLSDVKLIIVDEATSQLDSQNALTIEKMMLSQNDFGVVMVSHHFSDEIIKDFDELIDLNAIHEK